MSRTHHFLPNPVILGRGSRGGAGADSPPPAALALGAACFWGAIFSRYCFAALCARHTSPWGQGGAPKPNPAAAPTRRTPPPLHPYGGHSRCGGRWGQGGGRRERGSGVLLRAGGCGRQQRAHRAQHPLPPRSCRAAACGPRPPPAASGASCPWTRVLCLDTQVPPPVLRLAVLLRWLLSFAAAID